MCSSSLREPLSRPVLWREGIEGPEPHSRDGPIEAPPSLGGNRRFLAVPSSVFNPPRERESEDYVVNKAA